MMPSLFCAIVGPTAVGKTELSLALAEQLHCEILCVDSMQVYRGLDIGAAKPTAEEQNRVTHYGLDLASPLENYSASRFAEYAEPILKSYASRNQPLILCGGTGLYYRALLEGLFTVPDPDPLLRAHLMQRLQTENAAALYHELRQCDSETAEKIHPNDGKRLVRALEIIHQTGKTITILKKEQTKKTWIDHTCFIGIERDKNDLSARIEKRTDWMYRNGLLVETRQLLDMGCTTGNTALQAIGYKECVAHLQGDLSYKEAVEQTITGTRQYAKRQMTWFRRQFKTQWINLSKIKDLRETVRESLQFLSNGGMYISL
ncbi:MAG: tRNA (adenosine(37)-N6)-dimethylallyltransferase MiaA [Candidatus Omnitrophota bacterium]|jgi:tRNA dimethylallyltransferase|nr:MAG: tRNA (adenosine(37)-N6)-dimethylallyltransferase MiaA [Candidatus Omnitrophota bacterium]